MNRRIAATLFVLGFLTFAGCNGRSGRLGEPVVAAKSNSDSPSLRPVSVEVFTVPATAPGERLIPAVLSVENEVVVLAQRDGILNSLDGQEGSRVAKGQILAQLDEGDLRSQLRQASLEIERSRVEERQYDALVKVNRSELDRTQRLFKDGLTSESQIEQAQFRLDGSIEELEKTRLSTQVAQAHLDSVKLELEKTIIRAPINGIVVRRLTRLGSNIIRNDKLFEISQVGPLEVRFLLPLNEKTKISVGSKLDLSLAESDRVVATARVRRVDAVADAASNALGYLADVIGGHDLIPGLAVNVHIARDESVISIPRTAFINDVELQGGISRQIYVVSSEGGQDKCALRDVTVKRILGDQVEIESGLRPDDRVILSPQKNLSPGERVEIKNGLSEIRLQN